MLNELSPEHVKKMDIASLVHRMDEVRRHAMEERYGKDYITHSVPTFPLVDQFMATKTVASKNEESKRKLADCAFRYLLQMDIVSVSSGISNREVYGTSYHENIWNSPLHWMKVASLNQYSIVASRIALECFFDLIYMASCGKRVPGDRKFKAIKNWILKDNPPFVYYVGHIVAAFEFDREYRQHEIHGTSRFKSSLLTLHKPEFLESNISNQLTNILLNVWEPLLKILDGEEPTGMSVFNSCNDFAIRYFERHSDPDGFSQYVRELIKNKMSNPNRVADT